MSSLPPSTFIAWLHLFCAIFSPLFSKGSLSSPLLEMKPDPIFLLQPRSPERLAHGLFLYSPISLLQTGSGFPFRLQPRPFESFDQVLLFSSRRAFHLLPCISSFKPICPLTVSFYYTCVNSTDSHPLFCWVYRESRPRFLLLLPDCFFPARPEPFRHPTSFPG